MDGGVQVARKADTVLQTGAALSGAIAASTKGGKARLDGLYLPDGSKIEESRAAAAAAGSASAPGAGGAEVRAAAAMSKVVKAYSHQQQRERRRASHHGHTTEQAEDSRATRQAGKVLEKSSELELIQYRELFNFFDVDKDRTWGSIEFAQRMTDIGCDTTVETAANLLYFAGVRDVDRITYNDFILLMPKLKAFRQMLEKDAMRAFAAKDTRGRGWITCKALREVLVAMSGPEGPDEELVGGIVKAADRERTNMITFENFIRAFFGTAPILHYRPRSVGATILGAVCCQSRQEDSDQDDGQPDELRA